MPTPSPRPSRKLAIHAKRRDNNADLSLRGAQQRRNLAIHAKRRDNNADLSLRGAQRRSNLLAFSSAMQAC
jgi:hypothetical protein